MNADYQSRYSYAPADPSAEPDVLVVTLVVSVTDLARQQMALRAQSLQSWQWVIVCLPALAEGLLHLATDPRVRVIPEMHPASASRHLVQSSSCRFVCTLSADTALDPTFLEKAAWFLATNPHVACCNAYTRDESGALWSYGFEQGDRFLDTNYAGATALFFKDDLLATGLPLPINNDDAWEIWLQLADQGKWGFTIPQPLILSLYPLSMPPFQSRDPSHHTIQRDRLRARYGTLHGRFPHVGLTDATPFEAISDAPVLANHLAKSTTTKRILMIVPWLIVGGAERVNLNLISYLTQKGFEVSIVTTLIRQQHPWLSEFERFTPDVFILDLFLRLPEFPRFIVYLIRSRGIDTVIISNSYLGYQLLPFLRSHCPGTVFVDLLHSYDEGWKNGGYPRASVGYQSQLDLTIVICDHVKRWMVARGADPERIHICYTNVDVDRWHPDPRRRAEMRTSLGLGEDDLLIVLIGRLTSEKRPLLFAPIIAALRKKTASRFLTLVLGDGPLRGQVERQIRELRLSDVMRALGRVNEDEVFGYLAAADVFLIPSQTEGVSVATMEAMAMGVVPVSADVGGQGELITADCGVLIPHGPHEVDEYARVLARFADDPDMRRRMGQAARKRVERHFALRDFGPRMEALLEQAWELHHTAPRVVIPIELAREWAAQIIEYTRQEMALDEIWAERESWRSNPRPHPSLAIPLRQSFRRRVLRFVWAQVAHLYRWGVSRNMRWLVALKERLVSEVYRRGW
jgi:glycosyltransferase involved in cell wall biosynthesis